MLPSSGDRSLILYNNLTLFLAINKQSCEWEMIQEVTVSLAAAAAADMDVSTAVASGWL